MQHKMTFKDLRYFTLFIWLGFRQMELLGVGFSPQIVD